MAAPEFLNQSRYHRGSDVQLNTGDTVALKGDQRGRQIRALNGIVWVSQPGDVEDHLLKPGEQFTVTRRGMVVLEGISNSRVRILGSGSMD